MGLSNGNTLDKADVLPPFRLDSSHRLLGPHVAPEQRVRIYILLPSSMFNLKAPQASELNGLPDA